MTTAASVPDPQRQPANLGPAVKTYTINAGRERLEFVSQPERGYVVRTTVVSSQKSVVSRSWTEDAATAPLVLPKHAKPIGGLDRRGVYTVENNAPASANEKTIAELSKHGQVAYVAPLFSSNGQTLAIIPEIVVRAKVGTDVEPLQRLCKTVGCTIKKRLEFTTQEYLLEVLGQDAEAVFTAAERLNAVSFIEWAAPNTASQPKPCGQAVPVGRASRELLQATAASQDANSPDVFPNDEYFPLEWHLHNTGQSGGTPGADIRAPEAWAITTGDLNIVIAVVDMGVDMNHPDLIDNLVPGYDFLEDDNMPDAAHNALMDAHGTTCAGLIAAVGNNGIGVAGVAYNCKIMPIRVGDAQRWITEAEIAAAFRWAAAHGADILSNSWMWDDTNPTLIIHSAIVDITQEGGLGRAGRGCVVLFAATNDGLPIKWYPQRYPEVIVVGATDHNDMRWGFSDYGPELALMAASGCYSDAPCQTKVPLWTTDMSGVGGMDYRNDDPTIVDYVQYTWGTSASCPIAAGVAALILSVEPNLTTTQVRHYLERSAKDLGDPGRDDYYGWGRVDARAALDMVLAKRADLNNDWKVDEEDRAILMKAMETNDLRGDIAPAAKRNGRVDQEDMNLLMQYLGTVIPEIPEPGLIAQWKLDEAEGSVAHNATGDPVYNGILYGSPSWQPDAGKVGGALQFDGIDDYVKTLSGLNPADGPLSVFAWVKGGVPGRGIVSQAGRGANWLTTDPTAGWLMTELKAQGSLGVPLRSKTVITDGAWHRAGFVWDGNNRVLYVDDAEVARDTQPSLASSAGGLYIGAGSKLTGAVSFWSGLIDDVRIYNRAVKP